MRAAKDQLRRAIETRDRDAILQAMENCAQTLNFNEVTRQTNEGLAKFHTVPFLLTPQQRFSFRHISCRSRR